MRHDPTREYSRRVRECESEIRRFKNIETGLITLKLGIVAFGIWTIYRIALGSGGILWGGLAGAMGGFFVVSLIHERFIRKRTFIFTIQTLNRTELNALEMQFPEYSNGENFSSPDHPYAFDLNIFGPRSLFHYINRTATGPGSSCLAEWLKSPSSDWTAESCRTRQGAVRELSSRLDFRQKIEARGRLIRDGSKRGEALSDRTRPQRMISSRAGLAGIIHILPVMTLVSGIFFAMGGTWTALAAMLTGQAILNRIFRRPIDAVYTLTRRTSGMLKGYSDIMNEIEGASFKSGGLRELSERLRSGGGASRKIRKLGSLSGLFQLREAEWLHFVLNAVLLWDLHCSLRIERWFQSEGSRISHWFDVIGEFEALSSLAGLHFNHPDWVFPAMKSSGPLLRAAGLGHPLIPAQERVGNDVEIPGPGSILIVTGPNMAGKSTFLKTVGVNMALAQAGAPVCAREFAAAPLQVYTSMNVSDSLDRNLSLFYAELQRLKNILDGIERGERVLFLIDEILRGTNALDRQTGSAALLRQFSERGASGVVATHDLELTKLETTIPDRIVNRHFDGIVDEDQLVFDYRLHPGPCRSVNALILMRRIGIDV